jgi:hypothetical protein
MHTSQRVSRLPPARAFLGRHSADLWGPRRGVGDATGDRALDKHRQLACVHEHILQARPLRTDDDANPFNDLVPPPPEGY